MSNSQLHLHTDFSLNDAAIGKKELLAWAKENQATAVAITDHGNMMGWAEFLEFWKKENPETVLIPGIEAYHPMSDGRAHLVLLAVDEIGYHALMKAVTESNDFIDDRGHPTMSEELLRKWFGPGTPGHGHVVATSACMGGVLALIALRNVMLEEKAKKEEQKADKAKVKDGYDEDAYTEMCTRLKTFEKEYDAIAENRQRLVALSKKPYTKRLKDLDRMFKNGDPCYEEAKEALDDEMAESESAKEQLADVKAAEDMARKRCTELRGEVRKLDAKRAKYQSFLDEADRLRRSFSDDCVIHDDIVEKAQAMIEIFGEGNFYVEVQNHGIPEEAIAYTLIAEIAEECDIPITCSNDAHLPDGSDESRKKRQILRSLRFNKWEEEMVGDAEMYLKPDDELRFWLGQILPERVVDQAIRNKDAIAARCHYEWKNEKHYPKWNDTVSSETRLLQLAYAGIPMRYPNQDEWTAEHQARLRYEIDVIKKLDVVDYLLIVQDFLEYGRLLGKIDLDDPRFLADPFNFENLRELAKDGVGFSIGIGRGSAVGSLVCYLIGITGVDPMKNGLIFERFLNTERVSMPDIDSDFSSEVREWVLKYVKHKYGEDAVCCIMTVGTQAAKAAVRNCARLLGDQKYGDKTALYDLGSDICAKIPNEPGTKLSDSLQALETEYANNDDALEIIENAKLVEGTMTTVGMHAAGVIIADNGDVSEYIPLMYSKDGLKVTQFSKDYCEGLGLLKMDFLGLTNLSVITETIRRVEKHTGIAIEMDRDVDLNDAKVYSQIYAKANTDNVFQFESDGMKQLLKKFKPSSIGHLTLLNAMFRPGPIQYMDAVCDTKAGKQQPSYVIPEMDEVLGATYGKPIYQEEIMQIFNKFAGFTLGESDEVRRAMSKKKVEKMLSYKPKFIKGLTTRGASREAAEAFWDELVKFSEYAFNKSHAAAYAVTSYYTAWLKYYYPCEYLTSVLNNAKFEDFDSIFADARQYAIRVLPPDINESTERFESNDKTIRFGLGSVKQVGSSASLFVEARKNGAFVSFEDVRERVKASKDVFEHLIKAGAFDCFANGNVKESRNQWLVEIGCEEIVDDFAMSVNERDVLGSFLLGNPVGKYKAKDSIVSVSNEEKKSSYTIVGMITNLKAKITSKGDNMATFTLVDSTGEIRAVAFPGAYESIKYKLNDHAIVEITGYRKPLSEDDATFQLIVQSVKDPTLDVRAIEFRPIGGNFAPFVEALKYYMSDEKNGIPFYVIRADGSRHPAKRYARIEILQNIELKRYLVALHS